MLSWLSLPTMSRLDMQEALCMSTGCPPTAENRADISQAVAQPTESPQTWALSACSSFNSSASGTLDEANCLLTGMPPTELNVASVAAQKTADMPAPASLGSWLLPARSSHARTKMTSMMGPM